MSQGRCGRCQATGVRLVSIVTYDENENETARVTLCAGCLPLEYPSHFEIVERRDGS